MTNELAEKLKVKVQPVSSPEIAVVVNFEKSAHPFENSPVSVEGTQNEASVILNIKIDFLKEYPNKNT